MTVIRGQEFAKALEAAGVVSDLDTIERIVIDVTWDRVDIHVKRIGTKQLLGLAPVLAPLLAERERVVRYWSLVREELTSGPDLATWAEAGLSLAELGPWAEPGVRWCLFEDEGAPAELDGKRVEVTLTQTGDGLRVASRQVVQHG